MWTYLCQNIVHSFAALDIVLAENAEKSENLDLKEWIGDSSDIVLSRKSRTDEVLQMTDKDWHSLAEVQESLVGGEAHFRDEGDTGQQNPMIAVVQQRRGALNKVLLKVRDLTNDPDCAQGSLEPLIYRKTNRYIKDLPYLPFTCSHSLINICQLQSLLSCMAVYLLPDVHVGATKQLFNL